MRCHYLLVPAVATMTILGRLDLHAEQGDPIAIQAVLEFRRACDGREWDAWWGWVSSKSKTRLQMRVLRDLEDARDGNKLLAEDLGVLAHTSARKVLSLSATTFLARWFKHRPLPAQGQYSGNPTSSSCSMLGHEDSVEVLLEVENGVSERFVLEKEAGNWRIVSPLPDGAGADLLRDASGLPEVMKRLLADQELEQYWDFLARRNAVQLADWLFESKRPPPDAQRVWQLAAPVTRLAAGCALLKSLAAEEEDVAEQLKGLSKSDWLVQTISEVEALIIQPTGAIVARVHFERFAWRISSNPALMEVLNSTRPK